MPWKGESRISNTHKNLRLSMVESLRLAQVIPSAFLPKTNKIIQNVLFFFLGKNAFGLCYCRKGATTRVNFMYNGLLHANSSSRMWVCAYSVCWLQLATLWMLLCVPWNCTYWVRYNPSTQKPDAGGSLQVQNSHGLQSSKAAEPTEWDCLKQKQANQS